jgi:putative membrane protein (TIGR04086 family)
MLLAKRLGGIFMSKKSTVKNRTQSGKEKSFFVSVFLGTLISLIIGILLLVVSCFAGLSTEDPERLAPIFALVSLFITALLGGYIAARTHKENGLFCGALSGILLIGILVLLVFAFSLSIRISLFGICAPAIIVSSAVAGVCGVSAGKKPKNIHKKKF